jgi:hypothetical protein
MAGLSSFGFLEPGSAYLFTFSPELMEEAYTEPPIL